jgi:hypothetical protein
MQKEGQGARFVTDIDIVTNVTSSMVSIDPVRMAIMVLSPVISDKNVRYPLARSRDRQKVEVLFLENFSHA